MDSPAPQRKGIEMRNYRNAIAALVLALVFAAPAFADDGIMYTDRTSPAPPPANSQTLTAATAGIIYTDNAASAPEPTDTVTEIALTLLQSMLTLF
jgi:hypothetical protein